MFRNQELQAAFAANDTAAFVAAAMKLCQPSSVQAGASRNSIDLREGLQVQVQTLSSFEEMDGGDGLRDGAPRARILSTARTVTWPWRSLVVTAPTADEVFLSVTAGTTPIDGVYRTDDGYVVILNGQKHLPVALSSVAGLQYKDGGAFLDWLKELPIEAVPA